MRLLPSLILAALLAGTTTGQVIQLQAIADATADSSQPTTNFGSQPQLDFGKAYSLTPTFTVWFLRGHIQFDLTPVAGLGVPQRARLFWYQLQSSAAGCLPVNLHRITSPWAENTVDWTNKPSHDPAVAATACVGDSFSLGWKEFDVTALVQGWLGGAFVNDGMVIRDPSESTAGAARPGFGHSRESTAVALRPYLELDFGTGFGTGCGPAGPAVQVFASGAPRIGSSFGLQTTNLLAGSLPGSILGLSNTQWGAVPLPAPLATAGWPGCSLLVAADYITFHGLLVTTTFDLTFALPNNPGFIGIDLYSQTVAFGPTGSFHASNGIGMTIY